MHVDLDNASAWDLQRSQYLYASAIEDQTRCQMQS